MPLMRRLGDYTQGLAKWRSWRRWRRRLSAGIRQSHGRRRRQTTMRSRHAIVGVADRQRGHPWRVDSLVQRRTRCRLRISPVVMGGPATDVQLGRLWNGEQHGHGKRCRAACDSGWIGTVASGRCVVLYTACDAGQYLCGSGRSTHWTGGQRTHT